MKDTYNTAKDKLSDYITNVKYRINNDSINHPSHYTGSEIECIDAIENSMDSVAFCGYLKGNIEKYLWRYKLKEHPIEDLKKARWYLNKLIDYETLQEEIDRYDP